MNYINRAGVVLVLSVMMGLTGWFSPVMSAQITDENLVVTGTVLDENGIPLIGAGVVSEDGKRGAVTDLDGNYILSLLPSDKIIVVSYIGYANQSIVVDGRTKINVNMKPDESNALNEVVVIGYGTSKKMDLTGSVASVKMSDIEDTPSTSIDQALQGKVAGVDIMSTTGEPGAGTSIRVRGTRSIEASNEPLIVVDGVMDAVEDLNEINPSDIASINILKDASSTAIYGSRGANGVVMITTKKGVTAKPSVTGKVTFGVSQLARKLDLMNTDELIRYRNDMAFFENFEKNDGSTTSVPRYDVKNFSSDTDWLDEITRVAFTQTANLSLSGKVKGTTYYASAGWNNTDGIVDDSGFQRFNARFNISHDFAKWINLALSVNYTWSKENPNKANIGGTNMYTGAVYLAPFIGAYDEVNPLYVNGTNINTPRVAIDQIEHYKNRKVGNYVGTITLKPVTGLIIKSQNSYVPHNAHVFKYQPSTLPNRYDGQGGNAYRKEYDAVKLMTENTATYTKKFRGGHAFDVMLGYSASMQTFETVDITADGIIDDNLKWHNLNAVGSKENYTITSSYSRIVRHSIFARANYNYKSRYYLTLTARYDGSSNFAANRKWGFFPSGAFKWNVSNEKFLKKVRWIDNLALRLSYGKSGNDAIAAYRSLGVYGSSTSGAIFNGSQSVGFYPSRIANPDLTWETTAAYNVGLDFSVLKNRINLTVDAYYSRTNDLLLTLQTIESTGFRTRYTNLGQTSNRGVEFSLETRNIQRRKFGWTTELTVSHNNQMVDDIGHEDYVACLESSDYMMYGYKAGYPLNALWGFQYEGVFKTADEVERNKITRSYVGQTTSDDVYTMLGRAKYADVNHDGVLSKEDQIYLGSSDPLLFGGIQNTFNIYGFKVGLYFSYSIGGKIYNYTELAMSGGRSTNQYRYMLDAWHPVRNPESDLPRAGIGDKHVPSSLQVHDASYLRFKTATVSYRFDLSKKKKAGLRDITIGVTGDNLFLLSKYNGFDPDVSTSSDTSTLRRVDMGAYPRARSIIFTLQLRY